MLPPSSAPELERRTPLWSVTPERFGLNEIERRTPLWFALKTHMEQRRQHLREQNDSPGLDERKTAELRGRIAMLTELLALERKD